MRMIVVALALAVTATTAVAAPPAEWGEVEKIFGRKGNTQGEMIKTTFPRSDLSVTREGLRIDPGLALTGWIAFKRMAKGVMMMGDLVLLEAEVAPFMNRLVSEGIEVTALHNHLLGATPSVMYLHFGAKGDPVKLARSMKVALGATATPMEAPAPSAPASSADWGKVEAIVGRSGTRKGDLLQLSFPRKQKVREHGVEIPPFLGVATAINLKMEGNKAATTGDFVLVASEVNPVIKALVENGIQVTAVHNHMLHESPRLFFLHFWGYDEPEKLARGLRAALDKTGSK